MRKYNYSNLDIYVPDSILERSRGIIFQEELLENGGMLLLNCNWVHSFLLRNPIKLYFLDKDFNLCKRVDYFVPNKFSPLVFRASHTLEVSPSFAESEFDNVKVFFQETLRT